MLLRHPIALPITAGGLLVSRCALITPAAAVGAGLNQPTPVNVVPSADTLISRPSLLAFDSA